MNIVSHTGPSLPSTIIEIQALRIDAWSFILILCQENMFYIACTQLTYFQLTLMIYCYWFRYACIARHIQDVKNLFYYRLCDNAFRLRGYCTFNWNNDNYFSSTTHVPHTLRQNNSNTVIASKLALFSFSVEAKGSKTFQKKTTSGRSGQALKVKGLGGGRHSRLAER